MSREEAHRILVNGLFAAPSEHDWCVAFKVAIKALEQETVSKEAYDHEYFLRKELEIEIYKLKQQEPVIDKIRAEIEALPKTYPFVNHIDTYVKEDDVKKIIYKYKAESEDKE